MKKVLVFIESLDGGGAEAILRNTVSVIDKEKFDITVVTETDNERYTQEVKSHVRHRSFTKRKGSTQKDGALCFQRKVITLQPQQQQQQPQQR